MINEYQNNEQKHSLLIRYNFKYKRDIFNLEMAFVIILMLNLNTLNYKNCMKQIINVVK